MTTESVRLMEQSESLVEPPGATEHGRTGGHRAMPPTPDARQRKYEVFGCG